MIENDNKEVSELIYKTKYLQRGETFEEGMSRIAAGLMDNEQHRKELKGILLDKRFLPAGRVQVAIGAARVTTPYNCYVSGTIPDNMEGISQRLKEALETMRLGGGIGYDFSTLRPSGDRISTLDSTSCGPVGNEHNGTGFMDLFDAGCGVIRSAGHRRGAQMGVLRVDHPDIRHFIHAKRNNNRLTNFNISVGITDEFMRAVKNDLPFELRFNDKVYERVSARNLWDEIMRSTWDWAEPGVLFIDTINKKNNLWYCETIAATNPCGEQPLPPYGACLLGSFNLTKYITHGEYDLVFDFNKFKHDIPIVVRAMDNIVDRAIYPLPEQEREAKNKRRMGLGITGLANTVEILGYGYGSEESLMKTAEILETLRDTCYLSSVELAIEKGAFPLYDRAKYAESNFVKTLPTSIQDAIFTHGIRNSHLLSIAPTGTISLAADNISSGIEPPYTTGLYERRITMDTGESKSFKMMDYAEANFGIKPVTSDECSVDSHVAMLNVASEYVDSSVSKTCNVGDDVSFQEFKDVYIKAYEGGSSGCTTFRITGKRFGIMKKIEEPVETSGAACFIDPETGQKECS